jgi:hypothetical protein
MENTEAALQKTLGILFKRYPALHGFAVQKRAHKLHLSDIAVHPFHGDDMHALLEGEIAMAIAELIEDRPEAAKLLPGRTFARALH